MNFFEYIVEDETATPKEKIVAGIVKTIKRDCKAFLVEAEKNFFYRGSNTVVLEYMGKFKSRTDRMPKDTPLWMHEILDKFFMKRFKWKVRSEGIFVNASKILAQVYGTPYLFFPMGKYKYAWSPHVQDLFDDLSINTWFTNVTSVDNISRDAALSWMHGTHEWIHFKKPITAELNPVEIVENVVDAIANTYIPDALEYAARKKHEVAFKCENYYLVNRVYEEDLRKELFS